MKTFFFAASALLLNSSFARSMSCFTSPRKLLCRWPKAARENQVRDFWHGVGKSRQSDSAAD